MPNNIDDFKYQIHIDYEQNLKNNGFDYGEYNARYFLMRNVLGSAQNKVLYIDEISPSRTEVKVKILDEVSQKYADQ